MAREELAELGSGETCDTDERMRVVATVRPKLTVALAGGHVAPAQTLIRAT